MDFLLDIHSFVRWMIVITGAIAVGRFTVGWVQKSEFGSLDRGLASGFSGLMDLQVLIGLIVLFWSGLAGAGFPLVRLEHAFTMIVATAAAHLPGRWKNTAGSLRLRNSLFAVLGSLALIYFGVAVLPGGWSR